jgi:hypothetical protein
VCVCVCVERTVGHSFSAVKPAKWCWVGSVGNGEDGDHTRTEGPKITQSGAGVSLDPRMPCQNPVKNNNNLVQEKYKRLLLQNEPFRHLDMATSKWPAASPHMQIPSRAETWGVGRRAERDGVW